MPRNKRKRTNYYSSGASRYPLGYKDNDRSDTGETAEPVFPSVVVTNKSSRKAPEMEVNDSFAAFDSPTVCITISGAERKYYLHKRLLAEKCPYFATLFNSKLPTVELTESTVRFEGYGCTEEAFDALVEYVYNGSYAGGLAGTGYAKCTTHANVYVLGERLCMNDLKKEALVNMAHEFNVARERCWIGSTLLPVETAIQLIDIIYSGTPDRDITSHSAAEATTETAGGNASQDTNGLEENDSSTPESGVGDEIPPPTAIQRPPDKMRNLIAYHVSFAFNYLKKNGDFIALLRSNSEFLEDLLVHLPGRDDRGWDYNSLC